MYVLERGGAWLRPEGATFPVTVQWYFLREDEKNAVCRAILRHMRE